MNRRLVYLVGIPGSGKTTVMAEALRPYRRRPHTAGLVKWESLIADGTTVGVHLGHARDTFGGTDSLSYAAAPAMLEWLDRCPVPLIVGEGDRLGSLSWLDRAAQVVEETCLVWLKVPADVAAARRAQRGSHQNPSWLKGRHTKVARVGATADVVLDGTLPVPELGEAVRNLWT